MTEFYRRNPTIEESPLQGDLMLFDPVKSQFFVLNPTMAYLWRSCDGQQSFDRIVEAVPEAFAKTDGRKIVIEMRAALDELVAHGLVSND